MIPLNPSVTERATKHAVRRLTIAQKRALNLAIAAGGSITVGFRGCVVRRDTAYFLTRKGLMKFSNDDPYWVGVFAITDAGRNAVQS